jgi:uncharacterized protein with GYD domain
MSYYLYQLAYTSPAMKAMIAKPSDREAAARKLIEAAGGKLHHLFFAFGKFDVVCLIEAPNDIVALATAAAVGASGTISGAETTKLFSAQEAMSAMTMAGKISGSYVPPTA